MVKPKTTASKIVYDEYTKRLINVFNTLALMPAIAFIKDFTDTIEYEMSNWTQVRNRQRNYPRKRRINTTAALERSYGVNPLYLNGLSEKMFVREPKRLEVEGPVDYLLLEFKNKQKKKLVLEELQEQRDANEELRKQLQILQEDLAEYRSIEEQEASDTASDKKGKKGGKSAKG